MDSQTATAPQFTTIHRHPFSLRASVAAATPLWLRRWWSRRRTETTLSQLSDAILRDIGIERGQIPSIARSMAETEMRRSGAVITGAAAAVPAATANRSTVPAVRADAA